MRFDSASESKGKKRNKYNASEAGPRSEERRKNIKEKTIINYFNRLNYLEIMKKYLLFATAALALASCTNESYLGTAEELATTKGEQPISFGFDVSAATRADNTGATAAASLGNQFLVYAEKNEANGDAPVTNGSTTHQLVFPNYQVNYAASTAYTTTSNTKDWEYVGYTHSSAYQSNVQTKDGDATAANASAEAQTIKYWDFSATNYVYTAVSAKQSDISSGYVKFVKNTSGTTVYDKGYTVTLTADADPTKLYFSDRQVIDHTGAGSDRTAVNKYGGNVTLKFRNGISQIRVGMYETIPGWSVTINKFYYVDAADPTFPTMTTDRTDKFYANVPNLLTTDAATLTVTYINTGARLNQPTIAVSGTNHNYIALGGANDAATGLKANVVLATSSATPTFNETSGAYTPVFPQETNDKTLKLKIDYTLTAPVTGETIKVVGATAEVPAEYLQWKPNYKYTYLFKISDNTNGDTGTPSTDPAGLYPITFDAVEVVAEDGQAEYITTVSEPTITTFGVNSTTGKYVTGGNEYAAGSDIYATFTEGSTVKTPTLGDSGAQHVNVFKVTTPDATNFPITEASVAEAIANPGSITNNVYTCTVAYIKVTDASTLDGSTNYYKADSESRVPGATGYVATLAVSETDYHVDADPANSTMAVDIYTVAVSSVTEVTDATTLAAGTTYYKKDTNTKAPGADGYIPTIAVEGTDYEVAPKIKAVNINSDASTNFTAVPAVVDTVPGEDGVNKTIDALKLTGVKAGTYAIEYEASAAWTGSYKKVYKVIVVQ